jgi:hypothetical protein
VNWTAQSSMPQGACVKGSRSDKSDVCPEQPGAYQIDVWLAQFRLRLIHAKYLMKKYLGQLRIGGKIVRTVVYAENATHARLILQYQFGIASVVGNPWLVGEESEVQALCDSSAKPTSPKPPMSIPQLRINSLKQGIKRGKEQLRAERDRQKRQREVIRKSNKRSASIF